MPTLPALKVDVADDKAFRGIGRVLVNIASSPELTFQVQPARDSPAFGSYRGSKRQTTQSEFLARASMLGQTRASLRTAETRLPPAMQTGRDTSQWHASMSPPRRGQDVLDHVVEVLCEAMDAAGLGKPDTMRAFSQVPNPHRHEEPGYLVGDELRDYQRRRVLKALKKFTFCNIYELIECPADEWRGISGELGGLAHSLVRQLALQRVQVRMDPMTRATFWNTVGTQQRPCERGWSSQFAAPRQRRQRDPPPPIPGQ
mmetsp:Transcript_58827/g.137387  ORF Transcript_58827/g.137387 Transcript_58827/m.137387 type:complete len:258 (+) Transcript_58827:92-865(+)